MIIFSCFVIFVLGLLIGSFLNVVILRYNTGLSVAKGRSFCFSCHKSLTWYELFPVFSFIFQAGRCRHCKAKLSWQYPIVELLTGCLFLITFIHLGFNLGLSQKFFTELISLITVSVLLIIVFYDIRQKIIPDGLVIILGILAILFNLSAVAFPWSNFLTGIVMALPLFLISILSRGRLMGLGDPKLMLVLGWFLSLSQGITVFVWSFWFGAIYGLALLILKRFNLIKGPINRLTEIAFAPFIILAFYLTFFGQLNVLSVMF